MTPDSKLADTVELIPLSRYQALLQEHVSLALLGQDMRKAQKVYFKKRRETRPAASGGPELRIALEAEGKFDAAVKAALKRQQVPLPGMGEPG